LKKEGRGVDLDVRGGGRKLLIPSKEKGNWIPTGGYPQGGEKGSFLFNWGGEKKKRSGFFNYQLPQEGKPKRILFGKERAPTRWGKLI